MRKLNAGCGSIQPEGWDNADCDDCGQGYIVDFTVSPPTWVEAFDVIVANHLLSCFSHHELIEKVLPNMLRMLVDGGVLRILVPDATKAAKAFLDDDRDWFPQGNDLDLDAAFCTYLSWFGESKSIFTGPYLTRLLLDAGFTKTRRGLQCGEVQWGPPESAELDDRCRMSLIVEAVK